MSAARLLVDLARLGIRIEARGDQLSYTPRSAVTPQLAEQMKAHKAELLEMLQAGTSGSVRDHSVAATGWHATMDGVEIEPLFPPDVLEGPQAADAPDEMEDGYEGPLILGPDGWPAGTVDLPDPCPLCGGMDFYWNVLDQPCCVRCKPPVDAEKMRDAAEAMRNLHPPTTAPEVARATDEPWPMELADWTLRLTADQLLDTPYKWRPGVTIEDNGSFLCWLQADVRRGPSGPRALYGALQDDLRRLHALLNTDKPGA